MKVKYMLDRLKIAYPEAEMRMHNQHSRSVVNVTTNKDGSIVWFEDYSDESKHFCYDRLKVSEIITLLETFNPEAEIRFHSEDGPKVYFLNIYSPEEGYVLIEGEYDTCVQSVIGAEFHSLQYIDKEDADIDVYKWILDCGIDVDMMRKYFGDNEARAMEEICKEYGLI